MSDLHSDLREAQRVLSEAGIRTAKHGDRLVQYAPGIVGLYSMVTVERLADGRLLVDGRTPSTRGKSSSRTAFGCLRRR